MIITRITDQHLADAQAVFCRSDVHAMLLKRTYVRSEARFATQILTAVYRCHFVYTHRVLLH